MAKKRPSPHNEPPTASSSEDEEPLSSDDEEETQKPEETEDEETSSGEEDEDEEDGDGDQGKKAAFQVKPTLAAVNDGKKQTLESGSESDSETDSDAEPLNRKEKSVAPKPIASKPMEENPKKPKSKVESTPTKAVLSKRPSESERDVKDGKRAKKKGDGDVKVDAKVADLDEKKVGEDSKRQLFQRLWSEDDEIALLQGVYDYITKKGKNPLTDSDGFLDFVKDSIHFEATQSQVLEKIRRLRKKYENNAGKGKEGGKERVLSKPHDQKSFDLSKKIWGSDGAITAVDQPKNNGSARKKNVKVSSVLKGDVMPVPCKLSQETEKMPEKDKPAGELTIEKDKYSPVMSRSVEIHKSLVGNQVSESFIRNGLELIDAAKRAEFETRWNKLQLEEWELHSKRVELIHEQTACILEAMKSK